MADERPSPSASPEQEQEAKEAFATAAKELENLRSEVNVNNILQQKKTLLEQHRQAVGAAYERAGADSNPAGLAMYEDYLEALEQIEAQSEAARLLSELKGFIAKMRGESGETERGNTPEVITASVLRGRMLTMLGERMATTMSAFLEPFLKDLPAGKYELIKALKGFFDGLTAIMREPKAIEVLTQYPALRERLDAILSGKDAESAVMEMLKGSISGDEPAQIAERRKVAGILIALRVPYDAQKQAMQRNLQTIRQVLADKKNAEFFQKNFPKLNLTAATAALDKGDIGELLTGVAVQIPLLQELLESPPVPGAEKELKHVLIDTFGFDPAKAQEMLKKAKEMMSPFVDMVSGLPLVKDLVKDKGEFTNRVLLFVAIALLNVVVSLKGKFFGAFDGLADKAKDAADTLEKMRMRAAAEKEIRVHLKEKFNPQAFAAAFDAMYAYKKQNASATWQQAYEHVVRAREAAQRLSQLQGEVEEKVKGDAAWGEEKPKVVVASGGDTSLVRGEDKHWTLSLPESVAKEVAQGSGGGVTSVTYLRDVHAKLGSTLDSISIAPRLEHVRDGKKLSVPSGRLGVDNLKNLLAIVASDALIKVLREDAAAVELPADAAFMFATDGTLTANHKGVDQLALSDKLVAENGVIAGKKWNWDATGKKWKVLA